MKRQLSLLVLLAISFSANATRFDFIADIGEIRYHEASTTLAPNWQKHLWFAVVNASVALPNCPEYNGYPIISVPDGNPTAISILLGAKLGGKKVSVTIDDAVKFPANERCKLQYITLQ